VGLLGHGHEVLDAPELHRRRLTAPGALIQIERIRHCVPKQKSPAGPRSSLNFSSRRQA
jgi:hypothetical protein